MSTVTEDRTFTVKDFSSDQDIRWCPGCGDYAILSAVKKMMVDAAIPPEEYCFISGIGCSSRFPYYMNTYGIHGIHGRAMAIATGLKIARPDIRTYVITGDGDALSIGGNHTIHALRRNVNIKILLFNNQIYGLTKGQYSPTSPFGKKSKSTPFGSLDWPIKPLSIAIAAEATFVARGVDMHPKHLIEVLRRAHEHRGSAFVEIYQNCTIFNDGAFEHAQNRKMRSDHVVELKHGEPLIFGEKLDKGITLVDGRLHVVRIGENGITRDDLLVHNETADITRHALMGRMQCPELPEPIGVLRAVERPAYDDLVHDQIKRMTDKKGPGQLQSLLNGPQTWMVEKEQEIAGGEGG